MWFRARQMPKVVTWNQCAGADSVSLCLMLPEPTLTYEFS